jgi:serine/threonine protein kinase
MGVVYLAHNRLMGRDEVLKVVSGQLVDRPVVLDRFLREIRSAAKMHHTNIVTAYSAIRAGESIVIAMEYVEGYDLSQLVKANGPLPVAHACNFVHQAALGLQYAHEQGMVHRDIKPSNLILARQRKKPVVKVLDFGLAKVAIEGQGDTGLTREGQMLGTPDYIAPEQIRDAQSADIRADIYSLGCTLYYLLAGRAPFEGATLWDLYQAHFSMNASPLNLVRPEVPVELAALVAKMMAKDPERRFQQPKEVAQALDPFFKKGIVSPQVSKPEISQPDAGAARHQTTRAVSVSKQTPASPEGARTSARAKPPTAPQPTWETPVHIHKTGHRTEPALAATSPKRPTPPWMWPAAAGCVLLLGLVIALAAQVFTVKTPDGVIVLTDLPKDATVSLDGNKVSVTWPGGGKPAEITARAGKRQIQVEKDGFKVFGGEVTIQAGKSATLTVHLEPDVATKAETPPPPTKRSLDPGAVANADGTRKDGARAAPFDRKNFVAAGGTGTNGATLAQTPARNSSSSSVVDNKDGRAEVASGVRKELEPIKPILAARALSGKARIDSGHWLVEGRELVQTEAGEGRLGEIFFGDSDWTDYDFSVDLMRVQGHAGAALYFRIKTRNGDVNSLEFSVGEGALNAHDEIERTLARDVIHLVDHKWYRARASVRGNHVVCTVQDDAQNELLYLESDEDRHPNGSVGLVTIFSAYRFKNVKVTDPGGKTLWEMPPAVGGPPMPTAKTGAKAAVSSRQD